ncbi:hypothetical protein HPP92_023818 [Vanilla planifolia]|uniref:Chaperone DnaJ C-terminal domain-containing protein n=1 Tax=Vanilla planifolia TaxID=51239 RepID=A0A835PP56_VANPL|nr:hypothetical protein HPP92_023818 [Vanilla planifolia]
MVTSRKLTTTSRWNYKPISILAPGTNKEMKISREIADISGSLFGDDVFGSAADGLREKKAPLIKRKLLCSLEELYTGTTKEMKISREIADISGKMMPMEDILMININAGLKNGTKIAYPKKEDDVIPTDIVFVVEEMSHEMFTREGNDLITTQKISLAQALKGYTAQLRTLDGRTLTICFFLALQPGGVLHRKGRFFSRRTSAFCLSSGIGDDVFGSAADVLMEKKALLIEMISRKIADTSGFQAIPRSPPGMTSRTFSGGLMQSCLRRRSLFGDDVFGSAADGLREKKAPLIKRKLLCSLEELYTGTTKEMKISREIADISGKMMPMEDILKIDINAGLKNGTKIPYPKKDDDVIPTDIVFVVEEMPHEMFTREGNDLITTQKISLAQALKGYTAHLKTLDDRTLTIPISSISSIIHPRYEQVVPGEGMPIAEDPSKRGNLKIRFKIKIE